MKKFKQFIFVIFIGITIVTEGFIYTQEAACQSEKSVSAVGLNQIAERIDKYITPYTESNNFSGSVIVVRDKNILFNKCYGMSHYEHSVPVIPETKFNIESISKSFTTAGILLMQEKGLLNVKNFINLFLPDYPNGEKITIHHLLTHTSGLQRIIFFPDFNKLTKMKYTVEEVVNLFKDKPLSFKPGERTAYSNANFTLLAYIIEKISGKNFDEFLKENFFSPLDMSNTVLNDGSTGLIKHRAEGYFPVETDRIENTEYNNPSIFVGASSIYSTTNDLYKWINSLVSGKVLNPRSLELMFKDPAYGCVLSERVGRDVYALDGWGTGFTTSLTYFPKEKLTISVLSNIEIITIKTEMVSKIAAIVFGEDYSIPAINSEPLKKELTEKLAGKYKFGQDFYNPGGEMVIVERDGFLFEWRVYDNRYVALLHLSGLDFIHRSSWGRVSFKMEENGQINSLKLYGRFNAEKVKK